MALMAALALIGLVASLATTQLRRLVDFGIRPQPPTFLEYAAIIAAIGLFLGMVLTVVVWAIVRRRKQEVGYWAGQIERGLMVLGVLQLAAFSVLAYAVIVARFERQSAETAPLAENPLGYLPNRCRIVCDFNFTELRKEPVGKKLLSLLDQNANLLGLKRLTEWTGLAIDDIDRVAIGIVEDGSTCRLCIVIRTLKPVPYSQVRKLIGEENEVTRRPQPVFRIRTDSNREVLIWCRMGRLLIIDVAPAPTRPEFLRDYVVHKGAEDFAPVVSRGLLELGTVRSASIRVAGQPPRSARLSQQIRSLVASIQAHGPKVVAHFSVEFVDAETAVSGIGMLRKQIEGGGGSIRFFEGQEKSRSLRSGEVRLNGEAMAAVFRAEILPLLHRMLAFE